MTIGINLLREAREKFATAVAAVKDELKNPDTVEEVKPAAAEIGSQFDQHLSELGEALGSQDQAHAKDSEPEAANVKAPELTEESQIEEPEQHESLEEKIKEKVEEVIDATGNAIGEAKFGD